MTVLICMAILRAPDWSPPKIAAPKFVSLSNLSWVVMTDRDGLYLRRRGTITRSQYSPSFSYLDGGVSLDGGLAMNKRPFTSGEKAIIKSYYENTNSDNFNLSALCILIDRPKTSVSRVAKSLMLTNPERKRSLDAIESCKTSHKDIWKNRPHPRGALGMTHTDESKKAISENSKRMWNSAKESMTGVMSESALQKKSDTMSIRMATASPESIYSRGAAGYREDIGPMYFRSRWEANYARYLNWLVSQGEIEKWEYETDTFWFEKIKRGVRSYKPDFKIWEKGKIHYDEIKGYMDSKSSTKIKRMRIYHPSVDLRVVDANAYKAIAKSVSMIIKNWETARTGKSIG